MKPGGNLKKYVKILAGILIVVVAALVFLYFQLFTDLKDNIGASPNYIDTNEATRKLDIFRNALDIRRKGYIRLTEGEINSELHKFYSSQDENKKVPLPAISKCRVILDQGDAIILCWVRTPFLNGEKTIVWRRRFELSPYVMGQSLTLLSMHLGKISIPEPLWPAVNDWIGSVNKNLRQNFAWALELPKAEIRLSEDGNEEELKIFTYYNEVESPVP